MKNIKTGILSLLLILVLIVSSFVPSYASGSETLTYSETSNSGTRDVVCTSLDGTSAANYYKNYAYDELSNKSASELFTSLQTLMRNTHTYTSSYDDCHYKADLTDCQNNDGSVSLIYTSYAATMDQWNGWNREHVWPKSLGGDSTTGGGADLHHIRPSDAVVNSTRNNNKYGNTNGGSAVYGNNPAEGELGGYYASGYFEPLDNVKGDVARICLYVYVRWYDDWGATDVTDVFQSVDVLLEWCEMDPVDTWEMGRNEVVGAIQGNRNVFIDYPEYAWLLFDREIPSDMVTPSGEAGGNSSSGGTSGETSTCEHTNTTSSTTEATCTEDGLTTVTCDDCGATVSTESIPATGHSYVDGTCSECGDAQSSATTSGTYVFANYTAGTQYADGEEHALDDIVTVTTTQCYFTEQLRIYSSSTHDGFAVIKSEQTITNISLNAGDGADTLNVYVSDDGVTWTLDGTIKTTSSYADYTLALNTPSKYVKLDVAGSNQIRIASMTLTFETEENIDPDPSPSVCEHTSTTTKTTAATCTTAGSTTVTCDDCGETVSTTEIPATGHQNTTETTDEATCTEDGTITVTCDDCGATVSTESIPATGHSYVDGTCSECGGTQSSGSATTTTTATIIIADYAAAKGWVNGTQYTTLDVDENISAVASSSGNNGKYYTSGENWRMYQTNSGTVTFTASDGCTISSITITYASENSGVLVFNGTNVSSGTTVTVDSNTAVFSVGSTSGSSGQARITAIEVVYEQVPPCEHTNTTTVTAPATCTTAGSTTVTCDDCGETVSTTEIPALGHNYVGSTCERCGQTLPVAYFNIPINATATESIVGHTITLPDAPVLPDVTYARTYSFVGWALEALDDSTVEPTLYNPGDTVEISVNTAFYAVYSYTETTVTTQESGYVKKDLADIQSTDVVVITVTTSTGTTYALYNNNGTGSAPTAVIVTVSGDKIVGDVDDTLLWNISNSSGNLTIYPNGTTAKWLYCTSANNGVRVGTSSNKIFTIDSSSGYLKNTATSRYIGVYTTNPDWRCYTNTTGNIANQTLAFYVLSTGETVTESTGYTTTPEISMGFSGVSLNVGADLSIRYHAVLGENPEDYTVRFTMNGNEITVSGVEENGKYVFSFYGIAPQCMGDVIKAELLLNGEVIATVEEYSVKQYVIDAIAYYPADTYLHQLLYDMLVYGAEAQKYRGYNTDELVTSGVSGLISSELVPTDDDKNRSIVTEDGADTSLACFTAAGVRFDYNNRIYVKITTESIESVKITVDGEELEIISLGNNVYVAYSDGISALDFDAFVSFELSYDGDLVQTLTYTVNTYAYDKQDDAEIGGLALALYRYGASAKAYDESKA